MIVLFSLFGAARPGKARLGAARHGVARQCMAGLGTAGLCVANIIPRWSNPPGKAYNIVYASRPNDRSQL